MHKLQGSYHFSEITISFLFFCFFSYFNYLYFKVAIFEKLITQQTFFLVFFVNSILMLLISLPYIAKQANKHKGKLLIFFSVEDKPKTINYDFIISFLSDQALASFFILITIFTGKDILNLYGGVAAGFYTALFFILSILIAVASLVKVIFSISQKFNWLGYSIISAISVIFVLFIIDVSIRIA